MELLVLEKDVRARKEAELHAVAGATISGLSGHRFMARDWVSLIESDYPNRKVERVATDIAESQLYCGAFHENYDSAGNFVSLDCGDEQINIAAKYRGTSVESSLRTDSLDPAVYIPVAKNNISAGFQLFEQPWPRTNRKPAIREFQPWVAYTSGWAMFPEFWVWHQDINEVPVGPWVATGRYIHQAIRGVANWHLLIKQDMDSQQALYEALRLSDYWGVRGADWHYDDKNYVYFHVPPKPIDDPADGIGRRPVPNNGFVPR